MPQEQNAVLKISKSTHGKMNDYVFALTLPGRIDPVTGHASMQSDVETDIKDAIVKAAGYMHCQEGMDSLAQISQLLHDTMPIEVRRELTQLRLPLLIANDDPKIPWEICHDGEEFLFVRVAVGLKPNASLDGIPGSLLDVGENPNCLIIAPAPADVLPAARREALNLKNFFEGQKATVTCLLEDDATYIRVSTELRNSRYHIIHICGHTEFDRDLNPAIVLKGGRVLTDTNVKNFLRGNPLVFANTCLSSKVEMSTKGYSAEPLGFPFAFMNAESGRAYAFIGSPWRIDDIGASELSTAFYEALFERKTVGEALQQARKEVRGSIRTAVWASFILWGLPGLRLFSDRNISRSVPTPPLPPKTIPKAIEPLLSEGHLNRERLGATARQALHDAELEMELTGSKNLVTTTHFFIGLTKVKNGLTQRALHHQGFNPEDTRDVLRGRVREQAELKALFDELLALGGKEQEGEGVSFSNSVEDILQRADQMARQENPETALVEERDLLLGFLEQGGGSTRDILKAWEVDLSAMENFVCDRPTQPARHPIFDQNALLRRNRLAPEVQRILDRAWQETRQGTVRYLATPYLLEAMLEQGSCFQAGLKAQGLELQSVRKAVHETLHSDPSDETYFQEQIDLHLYDLSRRVQRILSLAEGAIGKRGAQVITEPYLLLGFLSDGGGSAGDTLKEAGVDLEALDGFVREKCLRLYPLFLSDGRLNLQAFDVDSQRVFELAVEEALKLDVEGIDTRRLVLGLAALPNGAFAAALKEQGWEIERLREKIQGRHAPKAKSASASKLVLTSRNISDSTRKILKQAQAITGPQAVTERDIALAFLELGAGWSGGDLGELGLNLQELRKKISSGLSVDRLTSGTQRSATQEEVQLQENKSTSRGGQRRKAFACYAGADRDEVLARIQAIQAVAPNLEFVMDMHSLRSRVDWEEEIERAVQASDLFYLFWSENARKSKWINALWRSALEAQGLDFIIVVPLASSTGAPLPSELASRRFENGMPSHAEKQKWRGGDNESSTEEVDRGPTSSASNPEIPPGISTVDPVHFTVTAPPSVAPNTSFIITIWAHLEQQRQEITQRAKMFGGAEVGGKGPVQIARGTVLSIQLAKLEDIVSEPREEIIWWVGEIGNATFSIYLPKAVTPGPKSGLALVRANGLEIARLHFQIHVGAASSKAEPIPVEEKRHRKAFASYSSADHDEVLARIQGIQIAAPDLEIFWDRLTLRPGQYWEQELWKAVEGSDVFYLFWSGNAKESKWVKAEWQHALNKPGLDFIDPVPLVPPEEVPPPDELAKKHFNHWTIAFMRNRKHPEPPAHTQLFEPDGRLKTDRLAPIVERAFRKAQEIAQDEKAPKIDTSHMIVALLEEDTAGLWPAAFLQQGLFPEHVWTLLQREKAMATVGTEPLALKRSSFSGSLLQLLAHADKAATAGGAGAVGQRELLLSFVNLGEEPAAMALAKTGLDLNRIRETLAEHPLFGADGRLLEQGLCPTAQQVLEAAAQEASLLGYGFVGTPHLFAGLTSGSWTQEALRRQNLDPVHLRDAMRIAVSGPPPRQVRRIAFVQTAFSPRALRILGIGNEVAKQARATCIEEKHLMAGFVQGAEGVTRDALQQRGVNLASLADVAQKDVGHPSTPPVLPSPTLNVSTVCSLPPSECEPDAWQILIHSVQMASQSGSRVVGTPHLFGGLLHTDSSPLVSALRRLRFNPERVRAMFTFKPTVGGYSFGEHVPCSQNTSYILKQAEMVAAASRRKITGEDILLAFVQHGGGQMGAELRRLGLVLEVLTSELFSNNGELDLSRFDEPAQHILTEAITCTQKKGHSVLDRHHLLYAMLMTDATLLSQRLREQGLDPEQLADQIYVAMSSGTSLTQRIQATADQISPPLLKILCAAEEAAQGGVLGEAQLLQACVDDGCGEAGQFLVQLGVRWNKLL